MPTQSNDLTGSYMKSRQSANLTPAQQRVQSVAGETLPAPDFVGKSKFSLAPGAMAIEEKAKAVVRDVAKGVTETPRAIVGGVITAAKEAGNAVESLIGFFNTPQVLQITNEKGEFDLDLVTKEAFEQAGGKRIGDALTPNKPDSVTGGLVHGVAQFLTGFLPATKALKGAGVTAKIAAKAGPTVAKGVTAAAAGAVADATVFDPQEERLSNLVEKYPELQNPITGYLAADPTDSEAEGRFKNALEGIGLGVLTEGFIAASKAVRSSRIAKIEAKEAAAETATIEKFASVEDAAPGKQAVDGIEAIKAKHEDKTEKLFISETDDVVSLNDIQIKEGLQEKGAGSAVMKDLTDYADSTGKRIELIPDPKLATSEDRLKEFYKRWGFVENKGANRDFEIGEERMFRDPEGGRKSGLSKEEQEVLGLPPKDVEPAFQIGSKKAGVERSLNINLENINTTDDVKELINSVGVGLEPRINKARREVITQEETKKLADDLNMSVEGLLSRRSGEAFNAEQAVGARRILVASGENLVALSKKAVSGSEEEIIAFRRAMAQHHAIQAQVSGLTAEAGRALQSFRITGEGGAKRQQLIKDVLEVGGGAENSKVMAGMISSLDNPQQLNQFVKQAAKATNREMLYEAWINGLLSSPATHAVNVIGNSMTAAWAVGERKVASVIGKSLDRQTIPSGEATQMLYGMVNGAKDGMRLAWNALKTGEPADVLTKQESAGFKSITGENLNLTGVPGRFADFMGEFIRLPSRFLTAGDEFFKTMGYRMELNAQAYRQATSEGLEGEALATRIYDIIQNPPENIDLASIDTSRYQTFTRPLGEGGQAIQKLTKAIPPLKVIMPFVRTPVNIMKYVGERTPLSGLAPTIRAEIAAGGARRDMALAKIATGSMVMAAAADMSLNEQITGAGPTNPAMRNILRATGWQPYSIKVGDEYIAYNRLDPIGATIGLAADIAEITAQTNEADALDIATAAVASVAQNVTSKTYLSGLSEFFEVVSSVSQDPEKNNARAKRWVERLAGSVVPSGVAQLERTLNPELNATQGILEKIKSRIPGFSDDLPPRRNIFGEPIVLSGGIGPDIMSPIYISKDKNDPIPEEIVKQKTLVRMPTPVIDGIKLDTHMYDEYIKFFAGENNRFVKVPLKEKLREIFQTPAYQKATSGQDGGKSVLIRAVFDAYRDAAKQMMREEQPALTKEIRDKKTDKFRKLGGKI